MKFDKELNRMKNLMNYGLQTESKKQYKSVEYQAVGADNKTYGIVREGTKFYIKVANKAKNVIKEDFDYIGGFMNRKNYQYDSYANALKNFEMKMDSLNEASTNKKVMVESWSPDKKEMVLAEASDKMQKEIARQRQIMGHAALISENNGVYEANLNEDCCNGGSCKIDSECAATQKKNIKGEKHQTGNAKKQGGDPFTKKPNMKDVIGESEEETLAWNDDKEYMDKSHGTEVGDSAPYEETVTEEEEVMGWNDGKDNIHSPKEGTSELGDSAPFEKKVTNELSEGFDDEDDVDVEDTEAEEPTDTDVEDDFSDEDSEDYSDDFSDEGSEDYADDFGDDDSETEYEIETEVADDSERLDNIEDMVNKIADKLGVGEYDDDELYSDEDSEYGDDDSDYGDEDYSEDMSDDSDYDFEDDTNDDYEDDSDDEEEYDGLESKRMRGRRINEEELDDFGKHPAYQKEPMQHPSAKHQEMEDYYDMNDESAEDESAYGEGPGSSDPYEITDEVTQAVVKESIMRFLNKKKH